MSRYKSAKRLIQEFLEWRCWTVLQLAVHSKVSYGHLLNILRYGRPVGQQTAIKLARTIQTSPDRLYHR